MIKSLYLISLEKRCKNLLPVLKVAIYGLKHLRLFRIVNLIFQHILYKYPIQNKKNLRDFATNIVTLLASGFPLNTITSVMALF